MKYLLIIVVIGLVFFLLGFKGARPQVRQKAATPPKPGAPKPLQDMVACAHCGLHLPGGEALPGRGGMFCSAEHRAAYEASHTS